MISVLLFLLFSLLKCKRQRFGRQFCLCEENSLGNAEKMSEIENKRICTAICDQCHPTPSELAEYAIDYPVSHCKIHMDGLKKMDPDLDYVSCLAYWDQNCDFVYITGTYPATLKAVNRTIQAFGKRGEIKAVNHFPLEELITIKGELTKTLQNYYSSSAGENMVQDFYPETYLYFDVEDRKKFMERIMDEDVLEIEDRTMWIAKPNNLYKGMFVTLVEPLRVFEDLEDLEVQLQKIMSKTLPGIAFDYKSGNVVQRYIENPLVIKGRKVAIRMYWMILSWKPFRVLLCKEGYLNHAKEEYDLSDGRKDVHTTFFESEHDVVDITLDEFERNLIDRGIAPENWLDDSFYPQVERIIRQVARAFKAEINRRGTLRVQYTNNAFFGFYGVDILVDTNLHVWTNEIQLMPGMGGERTMNFHGEVKRKSEMYGPIFRELFKIVFEYRDSLIHGNVLKDLESLDLFKFVINESQVQDNTGIFEEIDDEL